MLAKIWKKLLLAVCIIACLFNITYKIVHKTSLKVELQSVVNTEGLSSMFKNDKEKNNVNTEYIEGFGNDDKTSNTTNTVKNEEPTYVVVYK